MNEQNTSSRTPNKAIVAVIVIVLVSSIGAGSYYLATNKNETEGSASVAENSQTMAPTSTNNAQTQSTNATYKDGTYQAKGSYSSPGGQESIDVSLTIANGKITAATVESNAENSTSKEYQGYFINGYKKLVIGKSIDDVELDRVAGSSLTPAGFNEAVDQIKNDAAA